MLIIVPVERKTNTKMEKKQQFNIYIMFPLENAAIYNFLFPCLNFPWQEGQTNKYFPEHTVSQPFQS